MQYIFLLKSIVTHLCHCPLLKFHEAMVNGHLVCLMRLTCIALLLHNMRPTFQGLVSSVLGLQTEAKFFTKKVNSKQNETKGNFEIFSF